VICVHLGRFSFYVLVCGHISRFRWIEDNLEPEASDPLTPYQILAI
jgi:hypothetical protein